MKTYGGVANLTLVLFPLAPIVAPEPVWTTWRRENS
jgi:hypothetical protein